jgi:transcriptional regulator with XRE-family HTH domain
MKVNNLSRGRREVRRARDERLWELRLQGLSQSEIARRVGISQVTVSRTLKRLNQHMLDQITASIAARKAEQVAQLDHVVSEAMQAWERSKEAAKMVQKEVHASVDGQGEETITTSRVHDQDGDPRYLRAAMDAMAEIRKVLEMDRVPLVGEGGTLVINQQNTNQQTAVLVIDGSKAQYIEGLRRLRGECSDSPGTP